MVLHLFIDVLRNSILITGLVVIMMMMIESFNIESHGKFFSGLRSSRLGQVTVGALLGSVPGCMGGFATVSLYTHGMMSFGALIAMMIASSGDEAFVMLAMIPDKAMMVFTILFVIAVATGLVTDLIMEKRHRKHCRKASHEACTDGSKGCMDGYAIHSEDTDGHESHTEKGHKAFSGHAERHLGWKRIALFAGVAVFIAALAGGVLEHDHDIHEDTSCTHACTHSHDGHCCTEDTHGHGEEFTVNLLSEDWMNILFAILSIIVLAVLVFGSDHFVEEHLWRHVVVKHLPGIFAWTFGVLAVIAAGMHYINIGSWISGNTSLMILLAVAVGIIPESGPHLIFVTLYASGLVPLPVLLASSISQDGHASLPLLAESKKGFIKAKAINCMAALAAGFIAMALM
ncbi:MAG: putative manganese transporter [Bacteroidales bacterium]|nr:putative manganese transporter [Bacteroidales bacterium]